MAHTRRKEKRSPKFMKCPRKSIVFFILATVLGAVIPVQGKEPKTEFTGSFLVETTGSSARSLSRRSSSDWDITPLPSTVSVRSASRTLESGSESHWAVWKAKQDVALSSSLSRTGAPGQRKPAQTAREGWQQTHENLTRGREGQGLTILQAARNMGEEVVGIEPNLVMIFEETQPGQITSKVETVCAAKPVESAAERTERPNPAWPNGKAFAWHLQDSAVDENGKISPGYSQLKVAREMVRKERANDSEVRIAHLDTGYDPCHVTLPRHFSRNISVTFDHDGNEVPGAGRATKVGHGTGSLGILAGDRIDIPGVFSDDLGGAPDAQVFSVNIVGGSSLLNVVHFGTASMAEGIFYSVNHGADVITISAGGTPSRYWAKAVNTAYENGVPIFAAAGDFFTFPVLGFPITPYRTIYPAAFSRVMAVGGATANYGSYGRRGAWAALYPWNWTSALMRGSYGPRSQRDKAIAAYAPNVPWAELEATEGAHRRISVNGGGTSSTTPQVAAAAALWISFHNAKLPGHNSPEAWKRAEAVYQALRDSAGHSEKSGGFDERYFGCGLLRAAVALEHFPDLSRLEKSKEATADHWLKVLLPQRSLSRLNAAQASSVDQAQEEAFQLEAAQLVAQSMKLQAISLSDGASVRLSKAIAADRHCSPALKERITSDFHQREQASRRE